MNAAAPRTHAPLAALGVAIALAACGTETAGSGSSTTSVVVASSSAAATTRPAATGTSTAPADSPATTSAPATPTSAAAATTPATATPSRVATPTSAQPAPAAAVPAGTEAVYLVGQDGDSGLRLFREFTAVPAGAATGTPADVRATRAVAAAMAARAPYRRPWGERTVASVRRDGNGVVVTLSPGGAVQADRAQARLAVASLVWTATAAYQADLPVRIVDPGRTTTIGGLPTATPYRRADSGSSLAGIWVDAPGAGATVPAGRVVARGQASVWEANLLWSLASRGATVRSGFTTASVGAPGRGAWSVDLGRLAPGTYTLTLRAPSPKGDGTDIARTVRTLVVR